MRCSAPGRMTSVAKTLKILGLIGLISAPSGYAAAESFVVFRPTVKAGVPEAEARMVYGSDDRKPLDDYFATTLGFNYGVNRSWRTGVNAELERDFRDDTQLTNIRWENIYTPYGAPNAPYGQIGFYSALERDDDSDAPFNAKITLLWEKTLGPWDNVFNAGLSRQFGENSSDSTSATGAYHISYAMSPSFRPGLEYFANFGALNDGKNNFDDQDHRFGPVAQGDIAGLHYDAGVLAGLSDASRDVTAKVNLQYGF